MKTEEQILTNNLRGILKSIFENELQKIPVLMEKLEPKDRLNFICKLMPYVFPKLDAVHLKEGEPFSFD